MSELKGIWIVAESDHGHLDNASLELLSAGRALADGYGEPLSAVILGKGVAAFAKKLGEAGADKVLVADQDSLEHFIDEWHGHVLGTLVKERAPRVVLCQGNSIARARAARAAVVADAGLAAEISEIQQNGSGVKTVRACYGGTMLVEVKSSRTLFSTVQKGSFPRAQAQDGRAFETENVAVDPAAKPVKTKFVRRDDAGDAEKDVTQADTIVAGGYGLGKAEGFEPLRALAKQLDAAVGASRKAVDSGWIPYKHQVGLTGKVVKPKLYVAVGISGQVQHLAGMGRSDNIVAINTDAEAPLMKLANFPVQADLNEFIPAFLEALKN